MNRWRKILSQMPKKCSKTETKRCVKRRQLKLDLNTSKINSETFEESIQQLEKTKQTIDCIKYKSGFFMSLFLATYPTKKNTILGYKINSMY